MTMPSLATRISNLARDVREIAADHVELAVLEAQQAGIGLAKILCGAVVISILLVTAWLALVASAIVWATSEGVSWTGALIIAAVINIVAGAILAFWMKSQVGELLFSATLRQLRGDKDTVRKELQ
jgi:uncharacterized membrane protein YqjE